MLAYLHVVFMCGDRHSNSIELHRSDLSFVLFCTVINILKSILQRHLFILTSHFLSVNCLWAASSRIVPHSHHSSSSALIVIITIWNRKLQLQETTVIHCKRGPSLWKHKANQVEQLTRAWSIFMHSELFGLYWFEG